VFREHHYLNTEKLGAGVRCYAAKYGDKPIAFIAVAHVHMKSNYYRVSRIVVLPDYQGIGIGRRLLNFIAEFYTRQSDLHFEILTSNPQFIHGNMPNWKVVRYGHSRGSGDKSAGTRINRGIKVSASKNRLTATLQYIPQAKPGG